MGGIHYAGMGNVAFLKTEFEIFTERLLLRELDGIPWEAHIQIMKEADAVAEIAAQTPFPFLVFPCLFEERISAVLRQFHEREASYWGGSPVRAMNLLPQLHPLPVASRLPDYGPRP